MQLVCAILWRHLWPLWLHHIFRRYLINGTIFEKKVIKHKMCAILSIKIQQMHIPFIWRQYAYMFQSSRTIIRASLITPYIYTIYILCLRGFLVFRLLWVLTVCFHALNWSCVVRASGSECGLIFSTALVWNIFYSKKNLARYCHKCENVFM